MQFTNSIVLEMILSYDTGGTAIQIGPGPQIEFFDQTGTLVALITGTAAGWGAIGGPQIIITTQASAYGPFGSGAGVVEFFSGIAAEVAPALLYTQSFGVTPGSTVSVSTWQSGRMNSTPEFIGWEMTGASADSGQRPQMNLTYVDAAGHSQVNLVNIAAKSGNFLSPTMWLGTHAPGGGTWQHLTLLNGWTPDSDAEQRNGLYLFYTPDGFCRIEGRLIAPGVIVAGQKIANLPTNNGVNSDSGWPCIPGNTVQVACQCTGPANAWTSILVRKHNAVGNSACIEYQGFPNAIGANGVLVVNTVIYVGDGTTS